MSKTPPRERSEVVRATESSGSADDAKRESLRVGTSGRSDMAKDCGALLAQTTHVEVAGEQPNNQQF